MSNGKTEYSVSAPDGKVLKFSKGGDKVKYVILSRHLPEALKDVGPLGIPKWEPYGFTGEWKIASTHKSEKGMNAQLALFLKNSSHPLCGGWEFVSVSLP